MPETDNTATTEVGKLSSVGHGGYLPMHGVHVHHGFGCCAVTTDTPPAPLPARKDRTMRKLCLVVAAALPLAAGCADPYGYGYQQSGVNPAAWALGGAALGGLAGGGAGWLAQNQERQSYHYGAGHGGYRQRYYGSGHGYRHPPMTGSFFGYGRGYAPPPGTLW